MGSGDRSLSGMNDSESPFPSKKQGDMYVFEFVDYNLKLEERKEEQEN